MLETKNYENKATTMRPICVFFLVFCFSVFVSSQCTIQLIASSVLFSGCMYWRESMKIGRQLKNKQRRAQGDDAAQCTFNRATEENGVE